MSTVSILLFLMVMMCFFVGFFGMFVPIIPGLPVMWGGIFLYGILTHFTDVSIMTVVVTGVLMLVGTILDFFASMFGAKKYGASWFGVCGSFVGSVIGVIIFNIVGLIVGAFVGAFIGEFIFYRKTHSALKAGFGTIIGFVFGVVVKIFIAFLMLGIFILSIL